MLRTVDPTCCGRCEYEEGDGHLLAQCSACAEKDGHGRRWVQNLQAQVCFYQYFPQDFDWERRTPGAGFGQVYYMTLAWRAMAPCMRTLVRRRRGGAHLNLELDPDPHARRLPGLLVDGLFRCAPGTQHLIGCSCRGPVTEYSGD